MASTARSHMMRDPHIKVAGHPDAVTDAKNKIMAVLDTKSSRVTLKMDVSHTEHSHVIGRGGSNIKRVMQETGCHIHFPDSNRNSQLEKSNQVSLAGPPGGVEEARVKIRELLPLVFMFELPLTGVPTVDTSSPAVRHVQQVYGVTVAFKQRPRAYVTTVIVRGSVSNCKAVKEATALLMKHLTGNPTAALAVSMQLEIAPQHHLFMIGRGGANVKQLMQRSGATVHFPDTSTVAPSRRGTVFITGSIDSVYAARAQLIDCLPLVLIFDLKDDIDIDQAALSQLMEQLDVFISIKPKPKQTCKSVIVKSIERNAVNLHEARRRLLGATGCEFTPVITPGMCNANYQSLGFSSMDLLGQNLLNINPNALLLLNNSSTATDSSLSPTSPPAQYLPSTHVNCMYSPMMVLAPSAGYPMHSGYVPGSLGQNGVSMVTRTPAPTERPILGSNSSGSSEPAHSSPPPPPPSTAACPLQPVSPVCQPATSTIDASRVHHTMAPPLLPIARRIKPCGSMPELCESNSGSPMLTGATASPLGGTGPAGSPRGAATPTSPIGQRSSMFNDDNLLNMTFCNGDSRRSSESGCDSDSSDHRVPGGVLPPSSPGCSSSLFSGTSLFSAFDYEQKKLLANKAMQSKPDGESSRIPTDFWSGLGFSKSMPDSAIRDKLKLANVRYNGPRMTTTYENGEVDQDPWKNSNMVSGYTAPPPISAAPGGYPSPRRKPMFGEYGLSSSGSGQLDSDVTSLPVSEWPPKADLAELFSKLGIGRYTDLFQQQEIDLSTFVTLTDQDLKELGVSTFGARRKMLMAIAELHKRQACLSPAPGSNNPFRDTSSLVSVSRSDLASQSGRW